VRVFHLNSLQATLITGTIMMFPASCLNSPSLKDQQACWVQL